MRMLSVVFLLAPMLASADGVQSTVMEELPTQTLEVRNLRYGSGVSQVVRAATSAIIVAQLNEEGQVVNARLQRTSGAGFLDQAALRAVRRAQFSGDVSDVNQVRVPVRFRFGDTDLYSRS